MLPEELDPDRALAVAREAAAAGIEVLRAAWSAEGGAAARAAASRKGAPGDLVTEADRAAEERIVQRLHAAYPDHDIVAEESGDRGEGNGTYRWVVDPLDGTANFVHRIPVWSISVALLTEGVPVVGLVVDPLRDEWFAALAGRGATLDRGESEAAEPIAVSSTTDLASVILATGFPFRRPEEVGRYMGAFAQLFRRVSDMRRTGSAALDLAYVAAGRVEGFWEIGLNPWDIAAGELLVMEAGGRVSDWHGGVEHRRTGWIAAGNPAAHDLLLEVLAAYAGDHPLTRVPGAS